MPSRTTDNAIRAFNNGYKFTQGNTSVRVEDTRVSLYLHGNRIAYRQDCQLFISTCGWQTKTTKERLNGLPGVYIYQKKGQWYLNDRAWNGEEVNVSEWSATNEN